MTARSFRQGVFAAPQRKNPSRIAADGFWAKQITLNKTPRLTGPVKRGSICYQQAAAAPVGLNEMPIRCSLCQMTRQGRCDPAAINVKCCGIPKRRIMSRPAPAADKSRTMQAIAPQPNAIVPVVVTRCRRTTRLSNIEARTAVRAPTIWKVAPQFRQLYNHMSWRSAQRVMALSTMPVWQF
jgi:hypothetical protein